MSALPARSIASEVRKYWHLDLFSQLEQQILESYEWSSMLYGVLKMTIANSICKARSWPRMAMEHSELLRRSALAELRQPIIDIGKKTRVALCKPPISDLPADSLIRAC